MIAARLFCSGRAAVFSPRCGWLRTVLPYQRPRHRKFFSAIITFSGIILAGIFSIPAAEIRAPLAPCRIEVVEKTTGWPVPLVELRTTHHARFISDNAGVIAFDLPECMNRETWFDVIGHGYEVPKDAFGLRGVRLIPEPGKTLKVEVNRTIVAKRLGRLTGGGLFAESQKIGRELD